jgi:hypothetical protein
VPNQKLEEDLLKTKNHNRNLLSIREIKLEMRGILRSKFVGEGMMKKFCTKTTQNGEEEKKKENLQCNNGTRNRNP